MSTKEHRWVIVLAAGEGTRLHSLTGDSKGQPIPKQFCALQGTRSMLQETLERARRLVPHERIVVIVAAEHRRWWEKDLADLPPENIVVQPRNRGTAAGILLPLLLIRNRDPEAEVAIMPSDHFVARSDILCSALEEALLDARGSGDRIVLLGIVPEAADPDYGWILPAKPRVSGPLTRVKDFVEKPSRRLARDLMEKGALINTFLLAAHSRSLLRLYRQLPGLLDAFGPLVEDPAPGSFDGALVSRIYAGIPGFDFSRDLLQSSAPDELRVLSVPPCGWSDLGTPERVAACLGQAVRRRPARECAPRAALDLSTRFVSGASAVAGASSQAASGAEVSASGRRLAHRRMIPLWSLDSCRQGEVETRSRSSVPGKPQSPSMGVKDRPANRESHSHA